MIDGPVHERALRVRLGGSILANVERAVEVAHPQEDSLAQRVFLPANVSGKRADSNDDHDAPWPRAQLRDFPIPRGDESQNAGGRQSDFKLARYVAHEEGGDHSADASHKQGEHQPRSQLGKFHVPGGDQRQNSARYQAELQFEVRHKNARRDQRDENPSQRSSERNHQIEERQMPGRGPAASEFSVAQHAAHEQAGGIPRDRPLDGEVPFGRVNHVRHAAQCREEQRDE